MPDPSLQVEATDRFQDISVQSVVVPSLLIRNWSFVFVQNAMEIMNTAAIIYSPTSMCNKLYQLEYF